MHIYFDNTASTPLDPEVKKAMALTMETHFGNPSSIHYFGRLAKATIEAARKSIAGHLKITPAEIYFTSGGTEANNTAIYGAVYDLGIQHAITSPIEHHAVLHTLGDFEKRGLLRVSFVNIDAAGHIDYGHLEELLKNNPRSFVSLMHANNELSNLLQIKKVSQLCRQYNAIFHSDMVQTMGRYEMDLTAMDIDFASCSGHKFHGPKGCGILYINKNGPKISPLLHGGGQERNMRGGTENVYGIAGLAAAYDVAYRDLEQDCRKITGIKAYMIAQLEKHIEGVNFLGDSYNKGLYTILSVLFPGSKHTDMLLQNLDIEGVAASGGSACTSGANKQSHVLEAIKVPAGRPVIRFSFSKFNTEQEVDECIRIIKKIMKV